MPGTVAAGSLAGRHVLVTGASSGIGAAIVRACTDAGAAVAGVARRRERLNELAEETGATPIVADLGDPAAAARAVDEAVTALGGLDAVVNNAGVMHLGLMEEGRPDAWQSMLNINVLGLLAVTQAAVPHLRAAGGGDVVNLSSMSGRRVASAAGAVYAGTKHAVHAISDGLRRELHGDEIRVLIVSPGFVDTELATHVGAVTDRDRVQRQIRKIGLDPADVAGQIVHALSQPAEVTLHEIALLPTAQD